MPDICLIQTVLTARSDEALFVSIQRCHILLNDPWHEMQNVCCVTLCIFHVSFCSLCQSKGSNQMARFPPMVTDRTFWATTTERCVIYQQHGIYSVWKTFKPKQENITCRVGYFLLIHYHGILRYFSVCFGSLNIILSFPIFVQWKLFI